MCGRHRAEVGLRHCGSCTETVPSRAGGGEAKTDRELVNGNVTDGLKAQSTDLWSGTAEQVGARQISSCTMSTRS